jgi:phage-related baseplate assembly protein
MSVIDLSLLPAPDVVETLDFEEILAAMVSDLRQRDSEFDALLESDPAYKILEVAAYRELLLRQRVNDAARSVMLAYAAGSDLDHLAALYGIERLVIDPGDPDAAPPVPPSYESDALLRARVQSAPEGWTSAGSAGAYAWHATSASAEVKDASVSSPSPGEVVVTILSTDTDGTPSAQLLQDVSEALSDEMVRPLCDGVTVQAAEIVSFVVEAALTLYFGPDESVVLAQAEGAVKDYIERQHRLGRDVTTSGLYAALHQPGVQKVRLVSPTQDLPIEDHQAPWCQSLSITMEGRDE